MNVSTFLLMMLAMRRHLLIIALLVFGTLAVYAQVRHHQFLSYDDPLYITMNPMVQQGLTWRGIAWAFTTSAAANWHPLTWLSHMVDWQLFGNRPGLHHLMNVLLHVINGVLLYRILWRITGKELPAALVAFLFALHPLHVESVAWVSERKDTSSTLFWLLTTWAYVRYVQGVRKAWWYATTLILLALGLMAKPMLVTLPAVLLLLDYWPLGRWPKLCGPAVGDALATGAAASQRKTPRGIVPMWVWPLLDKLPLLVLVAASSAITLWVQSTGRAMRVGLSFEERASNALIATVAYIRKMVLPIDLAVFYPLPSSIGQNVSLGAALLAAAALVAVSAVALRWRRRYPYLLVGWLWFLGTLVPVIGLIQVGEQGMADRYTYVPLIGLFIMVAWGLHDLLRNVRRADGIYAAAGAAIAVVCAVLCYRQVGIWRDDVTLFRHAIAVTGRNHIAHGMLGHVAQERGDFDAAIKEYEAALRDGFDHVSHNNLGILLEKRGDKKGALEHFMAAATANHLDGKLNLMRFLTNNGAPDRAVVVGEQTVKVFPESAKAYELLGRAYQMQNRIPEAIAQFQEALRRDPALLSSLRTVAHLEMSRERWSESEKHLRTILRVEPKDAVAHYLLGVCLKNQNRPDEAIAAWETAVSMNPLLAEAQRPLIEHYLAQKKDLQAAGALNNLAMALAAGEPSGRNPTEAVARAEQACQLTGNQSADMLDTLAIAYASAGRRADALATAQKAHALAIQNQQEQTAREIAAHIELIKSNRPFVISAPR